jgi:hypothetical protein
MIAGTLYLIRVNIRKPITLSQVGFMVNTAGSGTSTGSFGGVYSSSGTLLSGSADAAAYYSAGGVQAIPLTTPQALAAGTYVWFAYLVNLSSSQPHLYGWSVPVSDANFGFGAASQYRFATNGTLITALPPAITPSSNSNSGAEQLWVYGD